VHALAHAINEALGAAGTTAVYTDPVETEPADQLASIRDLCAGMDAGEVDILMILGGNPAYSAPADLRFAESMQKVGLRIHLGLYDDETSALCHWHVPEAHELEAWGDARAFDGIVTIQQPMIEPLYGGRTACDLTAAVLELSGRSTYDLLRDYWKGRSGLDGAPFESFWRAALHEGTVPGTGLAGRPASVLRDWMARPTEGGDLPEDGLELVFRPDASVHDGRFANIGWLQELPRPATRLAWDNAALMSPATAARLGLHNEETIELSHPLGSAAVVAPVWILPGHADDSITVHLGYGRTRSGRAGDGTGFDAYPLRSSRALWFARGLQVEATGRRLPLACTQQHQSLEGRTHVRAATLDEFHARPEFAQQMAHEPGPGDTLYPPHPYEGHAWGMTIDLNRCVGCNACVVGCQSENNIPVVGREQVIAGREMHWIRVDRYFEGSAEDPHIWHQPVPCMHCENAPCEPVCPVGATVHSSEGLNDMVYNRCVGTRYCSNNCPYKVRRFNFLLYTDWTTPSLKLLNNPDVTVRSRGVLEKCTYCVQRINEARNTAHVAGRTIRDGEVTPACAQACPAEAIVFGDINDPESRVAKLKAGPRSYGMLSELNTRPRTTYLAALRNPNPEMPGSHALLPDAPAHADIGIRPGAAGAAGKEEI
ncbi:MAG TPA: 4Fe-4S dicluster domain-containing protein, partial [Candidatus Polarisedimenticolia bacterium]|nr:4Fe-4S dicluster domain-containing protein [Candidatus Polarisedimenticolia bacterium]